MTQENNNRYCDEYRYSVRGLDGFKEIGQAQNFGECRRIHEKLLPAELLPYYAGLDTSGIMGLKTGIAYPAFYADIPEELAKKYKIGEK